jgi:hypothetical protein
MNAGKPTLKNTIFDIEFEDPATYAAELATLEQHRKPLLNILRNEYDRGPKSEPFDEDSSWRALVHAAIWPFRRQKEKHKEVLPARRVERLHELAEALSRARRLAERAMHDDVGWDLFRGWYAEANLSNSSTGVINNNGSTLSCPSDEFEEVVASVVSGSTTIEAAASRAAVGVRKKRGPSPGRGILPPAEVYVLVGLYRKSTGLEPNMGPGPFAEFVEKFLHAIGRGNKTAEDYVVEALKYADKVARKTRNT